MLNKSKFGEEVVVSRTGNNRQVVEQFARPRPRRSSDPSCRRNRNEDDPDVGKRKELLWSETSMQNLQSELLALKAELDRAQSLNAELRSQNMKLTHDLSAAEAKIAALSCRDHQVRVSDSSRRLYAKFISFYGSRGQGMSYKCIFYMSIRLRNKNLVRCPFHTRRKNKVLKFESCYQLI